jgi:hypothetical protein
MSYSQIYSAAPTNYNILSVHQPQRPFTLCLIEHKMQLPVQKPHAGTKAKKLPGEHQCNKKQQRSEKQQAWAWQPDMLSQGMKTQ